MAKGRVVGQIAALVIIVAVAVFAHFLVVRTPQIALGGGRQDFIEILTTQNYPVSVSFSLTPDGWVELYLRPLTAADLSRVTRCDDDPSVATTAESCDRLFPDLARDEQVTVTLVARCDAQLDASSAERIPEVEVIDGSGALDAVGGAGCGGYVNDQVLTVTLDVDSSQSTGLRVRPSESWTDASLDQRIARLPWIQLISDPAADPSGAARSTNSSLTLFMQVDDGEVLEIARPSSVNEDANQSLAWWATPNFLDAEAAPYAQWSKPATRPWTQFLLVLSGVLFGVAASLAVNAAFPARLPRRIELELERATVEIGRAAQTLSDDHRGRRRWRRRRR